MRAPVAAPVAPVAARFNPLVCGDTDAGVKSVREIASRWPGFNPLVCGDTDAGRSLQAGDLANAQFQSPRLRGYGCGRGARHILDCASSVSIPSSAGIRMRARHVGHDGCDLFVSIPSSAGIRMRGPPPKPHCPHGWWFQSPRLRGYGCGSFVFDRVTLPSTRFNPLVCGDTDAGIQEPPAVVDEAMFQSPRLRGYGCGQLLRQPWGRSPKVSIPSSAGIRMRVVICCDSRRNWRSFNPLVCGDTDAGSASRQSEPTFARFNPLVCGDTDAGRWVLSFCTVEALFQSPRLRGYGCG